MSRNESYNEEMRFVLVSYLEINKLYTCSTETDPQKPAISNKQALLKLSFG